MSEARARERAKRALAVLVRSFEERDRGALAAASDATARSWVERLLAVFGWNADDPRQVRQEHTIQGREIRGRGRGGTNRRRPDYALQIGSERVLHLDVERLDVSIEEDEDVAFQVRSYGWSAGLRVSYACNFGELAIWDCRHEPKTEDEARVARLHHLRCAEYVEQFDLLWDCLSREAISGGSLQRLHPEGELPRGAQPLDVAFEARLSGWRVELARSILRHGGSRDAEVISGAAQRILDRIVFLRLCEEIGLEEYGALHDMIDDDGGFWAVFVERQERRYRRVYGGLLFPDREEDDPTPVEGHLRRWRPRGRVFERIIRGLYHPQPYRFDAVPLELLGRIYERFLGKRLRVAGEDVEEEFKPEHQRTKGAVYTPPWVVRRVVGRTLEPLTRGADPEEILALRILDPACGSASFLLGVYDHLEDAILGWARAHPGDERRDGVVVDGPEGPRLSVEASRRIVEGCLHGVDVDPNAVEVARVSLALRHLRCAARDLPEEPRDLLAGVGRSIRQGNPLVEPDVAGLDAGFHAVVGNPPYIEVKRYKEWMPEMYRILKEGDRYVTADQGKTDIAMPFMEMGVRQLRPGGRLGFIIQNRFFKTDYGELTRRWLREGRHLESVEDFRDIQVFPGRTTYTAILVLQANASSFEYRTYDDLAQAQADRPTVEARVRTAELDDSPWSLDQPDLLEVHSELARRHGTIAEHRDIEISVGLQTLYGKLYQLRPLEVTARVVRGVNGLGAEVVLERTALRPLCRNRGFYPFRADNADAWVIFPYDVEGDVATEIRWPELARRFPRTAAYLEDNRNTLRRSVEMEEGRDRWHLYTRPQNLVAQARAKILFPMTIEDTAAAVDGAGDVYQDNANVNGLSLRSDGVDLHALAAVFNSTLFSALARLKAGLNDAGWRKLNRQFAELVPLPLEELGRSPLAKRLAKLGSLIEEQQERLREARGEGERAAVRGTLSAKWAELDEVVEQLYGLKAAQRKVIARYPRRVDRVAWPLGNAGACRG